MLCENIISEEHNLKVRDHIVSVVNKKVSYRKQIARYHWYQKCWPRQRAWL